MGEAAAGEVAGVEGVAAAAAAGGWVASATSGPSAASEMLPGVTRCILGYLRVISFHV